jgi:hypothetical protein
MAITDEIRKAFDECTVMAGVENDFECVYVTKAAALLYLNEIDAAFRELLEENERFIIKLNAEHIARQNVELENAKLRELVEEDSEQLDKWQKKAEYYSQLSQLAEAENAKLRELVGGLRYCAHEAYGMCARVPVGGERPFTCCPLYDFDSKEYRCEKLMLELGVEVD